MEKYNYVMALSSLCTCAHSATHDMIKTHTTHAHENTSSTHDLLHMKKMHHYILLFAMSENLNEQELSEANHRARRSAGEKLNISPLDIGHK